MKSAPIVYFLLIAAIKTLVNAPKPIKTGKNNLKIVLILANIRLGCKGVRGTYASAYYAGVSVTKVKKSFCNFDPRTRMGSTPTGGVSLSQPGSRSTSPTSLKSYHTYFDSPVAPIPSVRRLTAIYSPSQMFHSCIERNGGGILKTAYDILTIIVKSEVPLRQKKLT